MEKQCSVLILPQAKPKTIVQQCSQGHSMGLFINDITIFQAGRGQKWRNKKGCWFKPGKEGFKKWVKTTVYQRQVLEFAALCNQWQIKTVALRMGNKRLHCACMMCMACAWAWAFWSSFCRTSLSLITWWGKLFNCPLKYCGKTISYEWLGPAFLKIGHDGVNVLKL